MKHVLLMYILCLCRNLMTVCYDDRISSDIRSEAMVTQYLTVKLNFIGLSASKGPSSSFLISESECRSQQALLKALLGFVHFAI